MNRTLVTRDSGAAAQAAAEDVFFGQVVMIWARWAVIAGAAALVILSTSDVGALSLRMVVVVALMAVNFFLHGRFLMERPANAHLVMVASVFDLVLITLMTRLWGGGDVHSQYFVFYYPVVMAFALVFRPPLTAIFTAAAVALYGVPILFGQFSADNWGVEDWKVYVIRLVTLAAMGGLGTYYWRIQRSRRAAASRR